MPKKDIVLIIGGGGMMGIFVAGVLEVLDEKVRGRIHSIYATSSAADASVYFVSGQTWIPRDFFITHLTKKEFIRNNWFSYIFKIFFMPKTPHIKDFINIDYFISTAQSSDCALNVEAFNESDITLFVKVINIRNGKACYLPTKDDLQIKLKATSQCGPLTTSAITVGGEQYIDGDTVSSDIDSELIKSLHDKTVVYIQPSRSHRLTRFFLPLFPLYVLAGCAIMRLYSVSIGTRYIHDLLSNREMPPFENVIHIKNHIDGSTFCTDKSELERVYQHGVREARTILNERLGC